MPKCRRGGQGFRVLRGGRAGCSGFSDDEPFGAEFTGAVFGVSELPAGEVGVAQVADLTVAYELAKGAEGFFDGGVGVGAW